MASGKTGTPLPLKLDLLFSTFIEVTGLITTGASLTKIVTPILSCACDLLNGKAAFAIIRQPRGIVRISFHPGAKGSHPVVEEEELRLTKNLEKLLATKVTSFIKQAQSKSQLSPIRQILKATKSSSVAMARLQHRNVSVGVIGVVSSRRSQPERETMELIEVLAHQAGAAIRNAQQFERTHILSITDGLTGAYNYRFLIDAIKKEIARAERFGEQFSIIMLDVDSLKEYNDVHGHLRGSGVIKQVAKIASTCLRSIDMLCKYGGDEFVVVLPKTSKAGAAVAADRLRRAIEKYRFPGERLTGKITASMGIASYPEDGTTVQELISRADKALYKAKRQGRNKVWLSGSKTAYSGH